MILTLQKGQSPLSPCQSLQKGGSHIGIGHLCAEGRVRCQSHYQSLQKGQSYISPCTREGNISVQITCVQKGESPVSRPLSRIFQKIRLAEPYFRLISASAEFLRKLRNSAENAPKHHKFGQQDRQIETIKFKI